MPTQVANLKSGVPGVYIGRGTPFGNPSMLGPDGAREEVIEAYKGYFYARLLFDGAWKRKVLALKGQTLLCHCKPLECHGDVIAEYLDSLR
jgi:hypothetical protein